MSKCNEDSTLLPEILAIVLKKLVKEDVNSAKCTSRGFRNAARNAQTSRRSLAPKMKELIDLLLKFVERSFSEKNILKVSSLVIESKNKAGNPGFSIEYISDYKGKTTQNTKDSNILPLTRIEELVLQTTFHAAQFLTVEEDTAYYQAGRNAVLEEYAERYGNHLVDLESLTIKKLKLQYWFLENANTNATKTKSVRNELQEMLNDFRYNL